MKKKYKEKILNAKKLINFINCILEFHSSKFQLKGVFEKNNKCVEIRDYNDGIYIVFTLEEFSVGKIQEELDFYKNPINTTGYSHLNEYYKLIQEIEPTLIKYKTLKNIKL